MPVANFYRGIYVLTLFEKISEFTVTKRVILDHSSSEAA